MWSPLRIGCCVRFFFFNDTATTEIYTLSLHDALPISHWRDRVARDAPGRKERQAQRRAAGGGGQPLSLPVDRESTRLKSSHANNSYAGLCLQKQTRVARSWLLNTSHRPSARVGSYK